jgi:hypothetical protein
MILDNASGAAFRADANAALAALASTMKGPNAPPAPIAGMMWLDDDTPSASIWTWKVYDGADWLVVGTINISTNAFTPAVGGPLLASAGAAATPFYSFADDPDTGFYRDSPNSLGVAAGGKQVAVFGTNTMFIIGDSGQSASFLFLHNQGASASQQRVLDITALNEGFVPLVTSRSLINTDGSGSLEILTTPAGSRASDRRAARMTVPGSGPVVVNSGGLDVNNDLRFNSGYGSAALAFGCRAWVNFNGTGTVAIRGSGGVTSITDNGVGDYTVNFNFTMPDANYAYSHAYSNETGGGEHAVGFLESMTTTSLRVRHYSQVNSAAGADKAFVFISVVR